MSTRVLRVIAGGGVATVVFLAVVSASIAANVSNVGPWHFIRFPNGADVTAKWERGFSCDADDEFAVRLDNTEGQADGNPVDNAAGIAALYTGAFSTLVTLSVTIKGLNGITEGGSPRMTIGLDTDGDGASDSFLHQDLLVSGTDLSGVACTAISTTGNPWFSTGTSSLCAPCADLAAAQGTYPAAEATFVMVIIDFAGITGQNLLVDEFTINSDVLSEPSDMGKKA